MHTHTYIDTCIQIYTGIRMYFYTYIYISTDLNNGSVPTEVF